LFRAAPGENEELTPAEAKPDNFKYKRRPGTSGPAPASHFPDRGIQKPANFIG
jgi:hypothetical protein